MKEGEGAGGGRGEREKCVCVHMCICTHLSHPGGLWGLSLSFFDVVFDPRKLFSSRCRAYGKALQEERAEEPASLGGCRRISHPRAVQGLLELGSVPRTQGQAGDSTTALGRLYLHSYQGQQSRSPSSHWTLRKSLDFSHI